MRHDGVVVALERLFRGLGTAFGEPGTAFGSLGTVFGDLVTVFGKPRNSVWKPGTAFGTAFGSEVRILVNSRSRLHGSAILRGRADLERRSGSLERCLVRLERRFGSLVTAFVEPGTAWSLEQRLGDPSEEPKRQNNFLRFLVDPNPRRNIWNR